MNSPILKEAAALIRTSRLEAMVPTTNTNQSDMELGDSLKEERPRQQSLPHPRQVHPSGME